MFIRLHFTNSPLLHAHKTHVKGVSNMLFVLPKEQELIPEYGVNIFRPSVRPCVCPPTDKRRVSILCVKQHIYVVFVWYFVHILSIML